MLLAGPGSVVFGAIKQIIGLFLAVYLISRVAGSTSVANQPVHQFLSIYRNFMPGWLALTLAVILVVLSQIKINVTNAYSGSLAWTNSFTRITKHYPGRVVFLAVNLVIALIMMEADMFDVLNTILGFYANCGMAWVVAVASDIVFQQVRTQVVTEDAGVSPRDAVRHQPGGLRVDAVSRWPVNHRLLRRAGRGAATVLAVGRNRHRVGHAADPGDRDQGQV